MHALRKALPLLAALVGIAAMGALVAYFGAGPWSVDWNAGRR
jgi:hypothetical protein